MDFVLEFATALGLALLLIGWRGRRIDRHPLCAACGFDLFGTRRWETRECPECGADVAGLAVRVGHRERRVGLVYGGLALLLPSTLVLGAIAYVIARDIDVTPYKPGWYLTYELASNDHLVEDAAFVELTRRLQANLLRRGTVEDTADYCLLKQATRSIPWSPSWGMFIEAAHVSHRLPEAQWERYAQQAFQARLAAYTSGKRSDPLELNVVLTRSRCSLASFVANVDLSDVTIDGQPFSVPRVTLASSKTTGSMRQNGYTTTRIHAARVEGKDLVDVPDGPHEMQATVTLSIADEMQPGLELARSRVVLTASFSIEKTPGVKLSGSSRQ